MVIGMPLEAMGQKWDLCLRNGTGTWEKIWDGNGTVKAIRCKSLLLFPGLSPIPNHGGAEVKNLFVPSAHELNMLQPYHHVRERDHARQMIYVIN